MKPQFLLAIIILLCLSCKKDEDSNILFHTQDKFKYELRYQIDSEINVFPITIIYSDSTGKLASIIKTNSDCSSFYKCNSYISQKFINVNTNNADAKITLWISKNDTVKAFTTGFTNVTLIATI